MDKTDTHNPKAPTPKPKKLFSHRHFRVVCTYVRTYIYGMETCLPTCLMMLTVFFLAVSAGFYVSDKAVMLFSYEASDINPRRKLGVVYFW